MGKHSLAQKRTFWEGPKKTYIKMKINKWDPMTLKCFRIARTQWFEQKGPDNAKKLITKCWSDRGIAYLEYTEAKIKKLNTKKTITHFFKKRKNIEQNEVLKTNETQMAEKPFKNDQYSYTPRKHIKSHLTLSRMAKINTTNDSFCWQGCGVRRILTHCWWK